MKKFFLLILLTTGILSGQNVEIPTIVLTNINFEIKIGDYPDTISAIRVKIFSSDNKIISEHNLQKNENYFTGKIKLTESGKYFVEVNGKRITKQLNVIPGILSIIPPLIAIFVALIFRQVLFSLLLGIFAGTFFLYDYNPLIAFMRVADVYIINSLIDKSHIQIIVFTLMFGGVIGLISRSGGTTGIANLLIPLARSRKSGLFATWLSGIIIFFDDYANTLVVGNLMRPLTDKLKISREKLAFIVDATSAPVASIFLISSWIGYEVGLIQDGFKVIGSNVNAYNVFLDTIIFRFYPIAMLIFIPVTILMKRDFGPMLRAEQYSIINGINAKHSGSKSNDILKSTELFGNEDKAKWFNGVIPILVIIFGTIAGLIFTGMQSLDSMGIKDYGIREIVSYSDSYSALLWASSAACIVAGIMIGIQRIMNLGEIMDAWFLGIRSMFLAVVMLTLAWSIGSITQDMKTADYIISIISDSISPHWLPVLIFIVCAATSFSTGTSWGTMAIMMPLVIPLTFHISSGNNLSDADSYLIMIGAISSVLAGSVFGDHCSPISDTTILSSMASGCDHVSHVNTQLPYAVFIAVLCMLLGDIPTAFGFPPSISILLIVISSAIGLRIIGKKVEA
ncbi:MAG: Na+/H+ antiporter NhaC family protein [Ignavibacterium album]|uniref:Na+/H+ antiporter NhaC family protein n=1 Tax=Ignavibacterium album TaxID=591197 RepID=UPI0026EDB64C|nr:Na+/H+ antiporter NhaC family protein [Ignavibacterium album]MBI5662091.1 Na+/H+ antiporter NhaC family protein [Ignavibacterium album]